MFTRLYHILLMTVVVIAIFFIVSSLSFTGRLAEGTLSYTCDLRLLNFVVDARLCCEIMALAVVATRWLAGASVFRSLFSDRFLMAAIRK
jgi:hypothetical protein